jgi:hypothetical protein
VPALRWARVAPDRATGRSRSSRSLDGEHSPARTAAPQKVGNQPGAHAADEPPPGGTNGTRRRSRGCLKSRLSITSTGSHRFASSHHARPPSYAAIRTSKARSRPSRWQQAESRSRRRSVTRSCIRCPLNGTLRTEPASGSRPPQRLAGDSPAAQIGARAGAPHRRRRSPSRAAAAKAREATIDVDGAPVSFTLVEHEGRCAAVADIGDESITIAARDVPTTGVALQTVSPN